MELTEKDRLILFNQLEILKHLNPEDSDRYDVDQTILVYGYKYNYDELIEGFTEELDESISQYVFDVFQMYRSLNNSYYELSSEEKSEIDLKDIKFQGYDGNEEIDYYVYARFVLEELKRYDEIYDNGKVKLNSHRNMMDKYNRMLTIWKSLDKRYDTLTLHEIKQIIK